MLILSHRGYWKKSSEKNKLEAFKCSFGSGFGTEFDVRDYCGKLVVSHDMPDKYSLDLRKFFDLYVKYGGELYLAINIKADGLQKLLLNLLNEYKVKNYFVFDMSVPDALGYVRSGIKFFARQSEFEEKPSLYAKAAGVWMDELKQHWIKNAEIQEHLRQGKRVCVVSPDLHKRPHFSAWKEYKKFITNADTNKLMLCTDFPEEARRFFYE